ncbi:MAG: hypothetical protein FJ100_22450 [Deltaproteobacteria bacterium]|nr:hypothetical protein [Deltaproteobacteria bacterium]
MDGLDLAFGRRCRLVDRVAGDRDDDSAIAIRGPLGTFNDDVDATPSDRFDGLDDPVELDWAA